MSVCVLAKIYVRSLHYLHLAIFLVLLVLVSAKLCLLSSVYHSGQPRVNSETNSLFNLRGSTVLFSITIPSDI